MRKSLRFSKKIFGRIVNKKSVKYGSALGLTFLAVSKGYRFYDEYAWKKEGLRRLKRHFFTKDQYITINGLDFLEYFFADYVTPMMHLEPKTMDEVKNFFF